MFRTFLLIIVFSSLGLSACGHVSGLNLGRYPDPKATPYNFIFCHGYNCSSQTQTGLNKKEWNKIKWIFRYKSKSAKIERQKIAKAIALIEKYIGQVTGTENDLPKAPIKRVSNFELDCIDETVNTTKYLNFLQSEKLLKFHTVDCPVYKGMLFNGVYPHNSASVQEIETGQVYVIDSYIFKNGVQPDIRPLESWLKYRLEDVPESTLEE